MSAMEEILDGVKRTTNLWTSTKTPLVVNANSGDTVLNVFSSKRFNAGDEFMIRNTDNQSEIGLIVKSILDSTHIEIASPLQFSWTTAKTSTLQKTFYKNIIQNIYLGDVENIPSYPAISITATSRDSEWMTLKSTKETFRIKLQIFVKQGNSEDAYRSLLRITDTVQEGLKSNFFLLSGPYNTTSLIADVSPGDEYVKVSNSAIFDIPRWNRILMEDVFKAEEFIVSEILDSTTIRLSKPACFEYLVADSAKIINPRRFIFNSWPDNIDYGTIFKGTMLKSATISWFAWQEEFRSETPLDVSLT